MKLFQQNAVLRVMSQVTNMYCTYSIVNPDGWTQLRIFGWSKPSGKAFHQLLQQNIDRPTLMVYHQPQRLWCRF